MPRLSKKAKAEWAFFLHPQTGRRTYNKICRSCTHECKQSFRALLLECPKYESKRAVRYALKKAPMDDKNKENGAVPHQHRQQGHSLFCVRQQQGGLPGKLPRTALCAGGCH